MEAWSVIVYHEKMLSKSKKCNTPKIQLWKNNSEVIIITIKSWIVRKNKQFVKQI